MMSTSAATTALCSHCGRPIIGTPMKMGGAGDAYHVECTLPPPLANQGIDFDRLNRMAGRFEDRIEALEKAVRDVMEYRVGKLPRKGWLRDCDGSRAALDRLARLVGQE